MRILKLPQLFRILPQNTLGVSLHVDFNVVHGSMGCGRPQNLIITLSPRFYYWSSTTHLWTNQIVYKQIKSYSYAKTYLYRDICINDGNII